LIYLLAFPSGEGGAGTATDEEKHLPADFDLSSKICKNFLYSSTTIVVPRPTPAREGL